VGDSGVGVGEPDGFGVGVPEPDGAGVGVPEPDGAGVGVPEPDGFGVGVRERDGDGEGDGVGRAFTGTVAAAVSGTGAPPAVAAPCAVADSVTWSPLGADAGTATRADSPDA
jgi:hypothetical protein